MRFQTSFAVAMVPFALVLPAQAQSVSESLTVEREADESAQVELPEAKQVPTTNVEPISRTPAVISLITENDLFGGTDRNYTNGLRAERYSGAKRAPGILRSASIIFPFIDVDQYEIRQGYGLAHAIYTPEDIEAEIPDPTDQPYAGWLYVSSSVVAVAKNRLDRHALQLNVGVIGPSAGADFVQTNWHEMIDGKEPRGWAYQLDDELGVELIGERVRRIKKTNLGPFEIDSALHGSLTLGNVNTHGAAGGMARIGFDLDADFGPPRIRPSIGGAGTYNPNDDFGGYLFFGAEGRYVVRNIFLDGNTFDDDGPHVTGRHRWVGDVQGGIAVNLGAVQAAFTYVHRTEQYKAQDGASRFGALSVSLAY